MDTIKQISIFARNNPGQIERITKILADEKISILAIYISSQGEYGVIKLVVDQCEKAFESLQKEGMTVSLNEVIAIKLVDKPGGLYKVAKILGEKKINVDNSYIFVQESRNQGYLLIEVKDVKKTFELLKGEKLQYLKEKDCHAGTKKPVNSKKSGK
jgi:hypothetical protein